MTKLCTQCDSALNPESKFRHNCGAAVPEIAVPKRSISSRRAVAVSAARTA